MIPGGLVPNEKKISPCPVESHPVLGQGWQKLETAVCNFPKKFCHLQTAVCNFRHPARTEAAQSAPWNLATAVANVTWNLATAVAKFHVKLATAVAYLQLEFSHGHG